VAAGILGVAAGGVMTARRRAAARRTDPFEDWVTRFRLSHEALRRNLRHFIALIDGEASMDVAAFGDFVGLYGKFLVVHHESEDRIIFPTLRRHGRLRSTDAAHLDKWSSDHREVNVLGEALVRTGGGIRDGRGSALIEIRRLSQDLDVLLAPHLAAEEEVLTPGHLAEMVPASAIADIDRQGRKLFGSERGIPLFFAHSLQPDEQKQVFHAAPWIFRRVIFPLMDRRGFSRFRPLALSPALAP
jgi:hypothetical protein